MRRFVALLAAVVLAASLSSSSLAAGPTERVNHVVADFTMLDQQGAAVGRVVADFRESSWDRWVPGTLDVYWAPYDPANPPFPFMTLQNWQVLRSHAQLTGAWFNREVNGPNGNVTVGGAGWYLCDFANPWDTGCRMFWVQFRVNDDGSRLVSWGVDLDGTGNPNDHIVAFGAGPGTFVLTFSGDSGS
jgi:hypothetical protein